MIIKGIDVSKHNDDINIKSDDIDWKKVKESGVDFAIIRTGFGRESANQKDHQFENYYAEATKEGVKLGAYHYSYATNPAMAVEEAEFCLKLLKGKKFEYPIFFDIEEERQRVLSKEVCTAITKAFCDVLERAGYWVGVYSYDSFFASNLDESIQNRYTIWVARVEYKKPELCKRYDIWQYSFKGKVNGIKGNVDLNNCYRDFPNEIKKAKKNGFKQEMFKMKYTIKAETSVLDANKAIWLENELRELDMEVKKEIVPI